MSARRSHAPSAADTEALFKPLGRARTLLIAVSGGPDSTALLLMADEWARRRGRTRIEAATVDHGLRPESAEEAKTVAALCARLGVAHRILQWKGAKPVSRLQERAREARYRLLVDHAKAIGADALLTAHHADDQAETVLFRLLRGSGVAGLRGMELTTTRDGMTLARPLIGLKKRDLIAFARARGAPFVDDPSNADPRFARTRLRALLAQLGEEGLDAEALDRLARRAGETERALAHLTAEVEARLGADEAQGDCSTPARFTARRSRSCSGFSAGASPRRAAAIRAGSGSRRSRRWRRASATLCGSAAPSAPMSAAPWCGLPSRAG